MTDPKENRIGNKVMWDGYCPFCRASTQNGIAPCGWACVPPPGGYISPVTIIMTALCTKTKTAAPPNNLNGPHNNKPGAKFKWGTTGTSKVNGNLRYNCPFCGIALVRSGDSSYPCGFKWDIDSRVLTPCGGLSTKNKPAAPLKPLVNCACCGAWAAEKHRIGCKKITL